MSEENTSVVEEAVVENATQEPEVNEEVGLQKAKSIAQGHKQQKPS